jgi:tetratricopeptide (TPR) repeat protein
VAFDREDTLKKAEKLLRQGRLEAAIAEYARLVDDQPRDWTATNMLGDLYVRAGQVDRAAEQYGRIAEHFMTEGFYQKAAALYKKILKLNPQDETSQLNLAEMSVKQGLLADAKTHFNAVAARRRLRGDHAGAASIVVRLGSIDPADFEGRVAAARTLAEMGEEQAAAERFRGIYEDLLDKDRKPEALEALRESVRLNPGDQAGRVALARAAVADGDVEAAQAYLDPATAGNDPQLLTALIEVELKSGRFDNARELMSTFLAAGGGERPRLLDLASTMSETSPHEAYVIVETVADLVAAANEFEDAATILREFVARVPNEIPPLLKLIEICVDGGLEATMFDAQASLADAYLNSGQAAQARVVAEDLVAREPWDSAHLDRFRRALLLLKVPDPDAVIAERLSGEMPFTAFADDVTQPESIDDLTHTAASGAPAAAQSSAQANDPASGRDAQDSRDNDVTSAPASSDSGARADAAPPLDRSRETLDQAFTEFRSEIDRQSDVDQSAQHMTLARGYLEKGMLNEALGSLHVASRAPRFRFEAASLLGRIYKDRGENEQAIEWLERAAEAPAPNVDEGRTVLYDLGALVEARGETARALAIFLELQSEAGDYRDVAERVERLTRVETGG